MVKNVLFLGAGASASEGLPLGYQLRDRVMWDIDSGKSLDYLINKYKRIRRLVSEVLTLEDVVSVEGDKALIYVESYLKKVERAKRGYSYLAEGRRCKKLEIVTVNYDELLDEALNKVFSPFNVTVKHRDGDMNDGSRNEFNIFKLHGTLSERASMMITKEQTSNLSPNKASAMRELLQDSNVFFVGYSGRDRDIQDLFRSCKEFLNKCVVVTPSSNDTQMGFIQACFKETIHMAVTADGFLKELGERGDIFLDEVLRHGEKALQDSDNLMGRPIAAHERLKREAKERRVVDLQDYVFRQAKGFNQSKIKVDLVGRQGSFGSSVDTDATDAVFQERYPGTYEPGWFTDPHGVSIHFYFRDDVPQFEIRLLFNIKKFSSESCIYHMIMNHPVQGKAQSGGQSIFSHGSFYVPNNIALPSESLQRLLDNILYLYADKVKEFQRVGITSTRSP